MTTTALILATIAVFVLAFLFSMLGLGSSLLYVPMFHKLFHLDLKTIAVPTALLLNGLTTLSTSLAAIVASQ